MAIRTVGPASTYPTIAAAMAASGPNDTIQLESGYSNEIATVTHSGMTVSGDATSTGIVLQLAIGIPTFTLTGTAPINVLDASDGNGMVGNDGNNVIRVTDGADAVNGGLGIDRLVVDYRLATGAITGDSTSDFHENGGTNSHLVTITNGTFEHFIVLTGSGADTITTGAGDDIISTGEGAGTVTAGEGANIITGGSGADTITALNGGNFIDGGDGTNIITSGNGADTILSGVGADTIVAGGGADLITVRGGSDTSDSGAGNDRLTVNYSGFITAVTGGVTGGNLSSGYTGNIADLAGSSVGFVNTENFTITTGSGNDYLTTGDGIDFLITGAGRDSLDGGGGDDTLDGGADLDTAIYASATQRVVVDLPSHIALGAEIGTDALSSIENVTTGSGNDAVAGDGNTNVLDGGAGIDSVSYYKASSGVVIDLAARIGRDGTSTDTLLNFENASGTGYNDAISGTAAANVLDGLGGIDTISYYRASQGVVIDLAAQIGRDGTSTDTLLNFENANGSSHNDTISGNAGANVLDGLGGIDTISYSTSPRGLVIDLTSTVVVDGAVTDIVRNFENVNATSLNDAVSGNAAANVLDGLAGIDSISYYKSAQAVTIDLSAGTGVSGDVTDTLLNFENASGSGYADTLIGNGGVNVLNGLGGADTLTGGGGFDFFEFTAGQAQGDIITDFTGNGAAAGDVINLVGFGTAAQGATFTSLNATQWQIHSGLDGHNEIVTLSNAAAVQGNDFFFV